MTAYNSCKSLPWNVRESAAFYVEVFGWQVRGDGTNHLSFTDATADFIGAWEEARHLR